MEEEKDRMDVVGQTDRDEIYTKSVRAGKRTYFFDVKATRRNDYYLTITESKKRYNKDGRFYYEKHKIFLYKEDFEKFVDNLNDVLEFIKETSSTKEAPAMEVKEPGTPSVESVKNEYTDVEFEDLENITITADESAE